MAESMWKMMSLGYSFRPLKVTAWTYMNAMLIWLFRRGRLLTVNLQYVVFSMDIWIHHLHLYNAQCSLLITIDMVFFFSHLLLTLIHSLTHYHYPSSYCLYSLNPHFLHVLFIYKQKSFGFRLHNCSELSVLRWKIENPLRKIQHTAYNTCKT